MKKIIKNLALLALTGILFTACNEDDYTGESIINYSNTQVTLSSDLNNITINEDLIDPDDNPAVIELTASIAAPINIDLRVPVSVRNGSSSDSDDYQLLDPSGASVSEIVIPALQTSASVGVVVLKTGDIEGDETLIIGATNAANFTVSPFDLVVDIETDYINTIIDLEVTWEGEVTIIEDDVATTVAELCAIDFDVILFDAITFANLGYILGSASCPESDSFGFADGEYILVADLYSNPHSGFGDMTDIPLTVSYVHEYFTTDAEIDAGENAVTAAGLFNLSMTAGNAPIALLNVSNGGTSYELLPY